MTTDTSQTNRQRSSDRRRRNRVLRYVALYAAGAFAAIEATDIAIPALGLPEGLTRWMILAALVGFPVVVLTAWFARREPLTTVLEPEDDIEPPPSEPPTIAPGRIAVLPFTVSAGQAHAYLAEGIVDLLSSKLCCAGPVSPVDPHALLSHIRQQDKPRTGPEHGRKIARRFGAGIFVLGNVLEAGGRLHIDATDIVASTSWRLCPAPPPKAEPTTCSRYWTTSPWSF